MDLNFDCIFLFSLVLIPFFLYYIIGKKEKYTKEIEGKKAVISAKSVEIIEQEIKEVVLKFDLEKPDELRSESNLSELGCDSLDIVEIIMCLEELYLIEISDDEANKVKTLQDLNNLVLKKLNKKKE